MTNPYRAMCAELLMALEGEGYANWCTPPDEDELCLRARALLAQPVAEGPTDEEIIQEAIKSDLVYRSCDSEETVFCSFTECCPLNQYIISLARTVLAKWGAND